ncbi:DUF2391 family protein [Candidatus Woesearchaeota archaeon]|nr:DUF2391 family protein [Candidatus Woesearchaeota archaeon]
MAKLDQIAMDTHVLRERLVDKVPSHFDLGHVMSAFFGALFFGFAFVLKGLLFQVGLALTPFNLVMIIISTFAILSAQIYFIGYTRVPNPERRHFGQFWAKRIIAYYAIAIFTAFLLLFVYGIVEMVQSPYLVFKLVIAISFPAAIGAGTAHLLGKY